jgi:hypothetical protein
MRTEEAQIYILRFRCLSCGKHDVFAYQLAEETSLEEYIRARMYQVSCNACGWKGSVCGFSAVRISQISELRAAATGRTE